jgi:hypothetical protein
MQTQKKIAVAGATGRVGGHVVDVLKARGHNVVAMSRSSGVDVITGDGLAEALAGVECVINVPRPSSRRPRSSSPPRLGTCTRPASRLACSGWWWSPSSDAIGSPRVTTRRRSLTSGQCRRARSPCVYYAQRSSTSSSASSSSGGAPGRSATCRRCGHSSSPPERSPRRLPTWPPTPDRPRHRAHPGQRFRRSPVRGRRASSRWRGSSRHGAATRSGSKA